MGPCQTAGTFTSVSTACALKRSHVSHTENGKMGSACLICCFKCAGYPQWRESASCLKGKIRPVVARKIISPWKITASLATASLPFFPRNFSTLDFTGEWKMRNSCGIRYNMPYINDDLYSRLIIIRIILITYCIDNNNTSHARKSVKLARYRALRVTLYALFALSASRTNNMNCGPQFTECTDCTTTYVRFILVLFIHFSDHPKRCNCAGSRSRFVDMTTFAVQNDDNTSYIGDIRSLLARFPFSLKSFGHFKIELSSLLTLYVKLSFITHLTFIHYF